MDPIDLPAGVLSNTLTVINVIALTIFLIYQIIVKWFDWKTNQTESSKMDSLIDVIASFLAVVRSQQAANEEFQKDTSATSSGVRRLLTEIAYKNAGAMNRDNSLRVIEQSFSNVMRDIVMIFAASLENNGYTERQDFIRNRVKTTIGQTLDSLRSSLSVFQMSVDLRLFFRSTTTDEKGERYVLAAQLWDLVEPLYSSKLPLKERLEEMRLIVPNLIRDYLASTKNQMLSESGSHQKI